VVASLQEVDSVGTYHVDHSMLLGETTGPEIRSEMTERLRLPDAGERIPNDRLNQIKEPQRKPTIRLNPEAEILAKLGLHDDVPVASIR
jgi:hypothetical protein